jgi:hypothetical protein
MLNLGEKSVSRYFGYMDLQSDYIKLFSHIVLFHDSRKAIKVVKKQQARCGQEKRH